MDTPIIHSHLQLINHNWTEAQRNQIIRHIIPDFEAATEIVLPFHKPKDLWELVSLFNKRTGNNGLKLSLPHIKMICNYLFFIRDMMLFFNLHPAAFNPNDPDAGYPVYTLQRGKIAAESQLNRLALQQEGAPDMDALGKFPTSQGDIQTYLRTTKMVLKRLYGRDGVPLAYLVRPNPQPADAAILLNQPDTDYHEAAISCFPQNNSNRIYDQKALYQFLLPRVVGTTALSLAPADHETTENGTALYTGIWTFNAESSASASVIADNTNEYRKLFYRDERSMSFDAFISKFKNLTKRLAQSGPQHAIPPASQCLELIEKFKAAPPLKGFLGTIPTLGNLQTEADLERLIKLAREYLHATGTSFATSNRSKRRSISATARANARGGRDGGRGRRGGRGRGGGRGKDARGKPKPKGDKVAEWVGYPRVDPPIWEKWSEAERNAWKQAKQDLRNTKASIISQVSSHLEPPSYTPTSFLPAPPTNIQPSNQSAISGVTTPTAAPPSTQDQSVLPPAGRNRTTQSQTRQQQQQQEEQQPRGAQSIRILSKRNVSANDTQHPMLGRRYPTGVVSTCEIDNHADTTCCGPNFVPLSETEYYCSVRPFADSYEAMSDIPVCSCATAITTSDGVTMILVFHQSLFFGDKLTHSLINPNQVRHFLGNVLHDHPFDPDKPAAIYHKQVTIPLFMKGTFSCFRSRSPTPEELRTCDHIDMTSSAFWDPSTALKNLATASALHILHLEEEESQEESKNVSQVIQLPTDFAPIAKEMDELALKTDLEIASTIRFMDAHTQPYSTRSHNIEVLGDPLYDHEAFVEKLVSGIFVTHWTTQTREVSRVEVVDGELRELDHTLEDLTVPRPHESSDRKLRVTPEHLSEIWHIGLHQADATLNATTQNFIRSGVMPLARRYRYDSYFGQPRIKMIVYTDTVFAKIRSLHQNTCTQLFVFANGASDSYHMKTKGHAGRALKQFGMDYGYPTHLVSDSAPEQIGGNTEFQDICKKKEIDFRRAEPYTHGQNQAEPHLAILKRKWQYLMNRRDVPSRLWTMDGSMPVRLSPGL